MARFKTPVFFSTYFKIPPDVLDKMGIFDPTLNCDTLLFIDPVLLEKSSHDLIKNEGANTLKKFYELIISLLDKSTKKDDFAYNSAVKQINKKEVEGTCLGYGANSISGRSLPLASCKKIIDTADEIIKLGVKDPELFIILPLFEEGIGADTISDITTLAIHRVLFDFTKQIADKLSIETVKSDFNGEEVDIIKNPFFRKQSPILLLPQDILRKLPFASSWDDIQDVSFINRSLRSKVNRFVASIWKQKISEKEKKRQLASIMKNKEDITALIEGVIKTKVPPYDFSADEDGVTLLRKAPEYLIKNPLKLDSALSKGDDFVNTIRKILNQFKFLIEEKGMNLFLWKENGRPNIELYSQRLFQLVAYNYCQSNDIDINPEIDTGIGLVDVKFSKGFKQRVIVEIKHSYNSNIVEGYRTQLETYKKSEQTDKGFYVIIDVGSIGKKYDTLLEIAKTDINNKSEIIYIDANKKPSASKRKTKDKKLLSHGLDGALFETIEFDLPEIDLSDFETVEFKL